VHIVNVGYDATNYYVLSSGQSRLLIDVGWPGTLPKLAHGLRVKGLAVRDLTHLLATHYHPDHAGLAEDVKQLGVRLIVAESQLSAVAQLRRYMKPTHPFKDITLRNAIVLRAADSRAFLHTLGIAGEILDTPGHTDDSVTLVLDQGAAFTGDLPGPLAVTDDALEAVTLSWSGIRARNVRRIYPGHGPDRPLADVTA